MGREISFFSDYHTKENSLTNNCGIILNMLYLENPKSFEEVISSLTSLSFMIAPSFEQQVKVNDSVPDLCIKQKSFQILFETKRFDWFYDNQIESHLKNFKLESNFNYKILFLLSNFEEDDLEIKFEQQIQKAEKEFDITLIPISFEKLLSVLESVDSSDSFKNFLRQFREYLERNEYFPKWKNLLEVVNCAGTIDEVHNHNVFMCPNTGGVYSHRRAKFFGGYKSKNVKFIHEIKAIVIIEQNFENCYIRFNNTSASSDELIKEAIFKIKNITHREEEIRNNGLQVFLLENPFEVNFRKNSDGGMYGNKKYFWDIAKKYNAKNSQELANALKKHEPTWT